MNSWETTISADVRQNDLKSDNSHFVDDDLSTRLALPLRTRIALWVLMGCALGTIALLYDRSRREAVKVEPPVPAAVATSAEIKPEKKTSSPAVPKATKNETPLTPALAEIDVLITLAREDPTFNARAAVARLKPYTESDDPVVREAAQKALQPLAGEMEVKARSYARAAAELALDQAEDGDYITAQKTLQAAAKMLPADVPWANDQGAKKIKNILESVNARREQQKLTAMKEIEAAFRANDASAKEHAAVWFKHRDPELRAAADAMKAKIIEELHSDLIKRQERDANERAAWLEFFSKFSNAIAEGDLEAAELSATNCNLPNIAPSAVPDGKKVLEGCLADIALIKKLQEQALQKARGSRRVVNFTLRRGRVDGKLDGVDGRQMFVSLNGGARVGVKIENLSWASLIAMFEPKELGALDLMPVVWALNAYENPTEAATKLPEIYTNAKLPLPLQWAERFRLEKFRQSDQDLATKLKQLSDAVQGGNADTIKDALESARPVIKAFEAAEPLSEARKKIIAEAEKIVGKASRSRIVLQNGVTPNVDFAGINTDQISQYRESSRKTDVGVQFGLKLGSSGGVHRVLIHFDGIEAAIGRARVKKATLEFYQIESPQAKDTQVALFRLKRAWAPDAGTWVSFNSAQKDADWAIAGASGDADVESKEESKLALDDKKNVWRSFDITAYVQEILAGRLPNNGFLMRVINGEPEHQARFYPETDVDAAKDKSHRPRLVLDVEAE